MNESDTKKFTFVKIPKVILTDPCLEPSAIRIYSAVRSYADGKTGSNCFPSIQNIAKRACCSKSTVNRQLGVLKNKNYIQWKRGCKGKSNEYFFPIEKKNNNTRVAPMTLPAFIHDTIPISSATHNQELYTKNYNQESTLPIKRKNRLFHGKDKCSVLEDGTIKICITHLDEWKVYGGGDDDAFRFNELSGKEARMAALNKYAPNRS